MNALIPAAVFGAVVALGMGAAGYVAGSSQAPDAVAPAASSAPDRAAVEAIVRDYLVTNPEIMIEVQQALEARQAETQRVAQTEIIRSAESQIFNASYDGIIGNPDGDVTIVEFFDYNCGYCKRALSDMEALVEQDTNLRFVLKEFPILGPDSQRAHVVSMAFRNLLPENYAAFHRDLLASEARVTEDEAILAAVSHGADEAALRQEMQNPDIIAAFQETYALADQLSITGTPSYVVGGEVVFGAMGQEVLAQKIEEVRAENPS
ncbi:DsbA family protein [Aliihoeflea sp. 40Bstr573]|uniref:DsbA family protein n=1 Tax=Aliihoeflea sp. 40Bstr573 TaxID=2696467 RepID=UPI002095513F|nr:DsbA family protein [Aliihoeflea sp. 40Bstr573]MCO6385948.1 thioredoxin domain-containing protein [Aliihoeflea sp. 40Bstr573]